MLDLGDAGIDDAMMKKTRLAVLILKTRGLLLAAGIESLQLREIDGKIRATYTGPEGTSSVDMSVFGRGAAPTGAASAPGPAASAPAPMTAARVFETLLTMIPMFKKRASESTAVVDLTA